MAPLHRKLLRDLARLKGQAAAIGVVIAAGVMVLILSVTTHDAISLSKGRFYDSHHFAQVFADLKRAPEGVAGRLADIPGVNQVQTRVKAPVRLEVPGFDDPVRGLLISLPDGEQPQLNRLYLRQGSLPASGRGDQVVIGEPFAQAHDLTPGDALTAIIDGRLERLTISGVALSPEFIYQLGPADLLPDYARFTVLWMNRRALGHAMDMDGAFNNVVLSLQAGAQEAQVIDAVDQALALYGGIGATGRDDQISHRFLTEELNQLRVMAWVLPAIFLGVAAFLLNVLMARIIRTQRQQVALLKAFGYDNRDLAIHYGLFTGVIVAGGGALGVALGAWAAEGMAGIYAEYFRFPELSFRLQPRILALAFMISSGAALLGTWHAVSAAVRLPPAQAMRPPAPERFRPSWLERSALGRRLDQPTRIIIRNLSRHRLKGLMSMVGIGLSGSLLLLGSYQFNAVDHLLDLQYRLVMKMDLHVTFTDPTPERALAELRSMPGVSFAEGYRSVPVHLTHGRLDYRTAIMGMEAEPALRGLLDQDHRPIRLPPEGLLLTDYLAQYLGVHPGDTLDVEILEGHRRTLRVEVAGTVDEPIGVSAYMERRALNRLMGEGPAISGVWLLADTAYQADLFDRLWEAPRVAGIGQIDDMERQFREYIGDTVLVTMGILLLMAGSITFAVVYNNARIAFAERARELATLRVLGFSRGEVSWILIGEISVITLAAIPLGWLLGAGFAYLLNEAMTMDMYRVPMIITPRSYAFSAGGVLLASVLSLLLIARRLRRLDMVSALKTAE
ncbi:ABC transporter permease [Ectothiorhodospira marina]|uniref:Putative ABC transport system permease protein n=1 Tax=Ectothiorhodospira marina TaxID=1396821 RepID=A0A1H7IIS4_9GAMM|nr:ABC transporter permease [Ectothiorhodospira marina]SEK61460.1 putative ABC transport system permease protein [Ectothiorhodospira marina]